MTKKIKTVKTQNVVSPHASHKEDQQKIDIIFKELKKMYPAPETELIFHTPFQLLMAVMLSAQTTDKTVNKVTDAIRPSIKSPQDLLQHSQSRIESKIKSVNYFRAKSKHLRETANLLVKNSPSNIKKKDGYIIPDSIEGLTELPGVGIKTAKVVLHCLYGKAYIAADTHVHRVANRLGLTNTKNPEKTSEKLEEIIPKKYKGIAHHSLILFGRYHCTARNPKCSDCPFASRCPSKII